MDAGELVPDDIMVGIVARAPRRATTPRTAATSSTASPARSRQAEALARDHRATQPLDLVIDLEVPDEVVLERTRRPPGVHRLRHQLLRRQPAQVRLDLRQLRRRGRPARRRHRGGHPASASTSTSADRAAHRLVPEPRPAGRGRRARAPPTRSPRRLVAAIDARGASSRRCRDVQRVAPTDAGQDAPGRAGRGRDARRASARPSGPGVTTAELDRIGRDVIDRRGARSNFLGYGHPPFPA